MAAEVGAAGVAVAVGMVAPGLVGSRVGTSRASGKSKSSSPVCSVALAMSDSAVRGMVSTLGFCDACRRSW